MDLVRWCEDYLRSESAVRVMYKVSEVGRISPRKGAFYAPLSMMDYVRRAWRTLRDLRRWFDEVE